MKKKSRYRLISCCLTVILNYRGYKECVFHHKINNVWEFSWWSLQHYTCLVVIQCLDSSDVCLISFSFWIWFGNICDKGVFFFLCFIQHHMHNLCVFTVTCRRVVSCSALLTCSGLICSDVGKTSGYEGRSKTRSSASSCCWVKASALRCFRKLSTLPWESLFGPEPSEPSTRRKSNNRDTDPGKLAFTSSYALYILLMFFFFCTTSVGDLSRTEKGWSAGFSTP